MASTAAQKRATAKTAAKPKVMTFTFGDEDEDEALEVSHVVKIGDHEFRSLKEPNAFNVAKIHDGDLISVVRAYCHPDDWFRLDAVLSARRVVSSDHLFGLIALFGGAQLETPPES